MILITGAFGQVGKILQERLAGKNKLILVDRSFDENFHMDSSSEFMIGDLQDIEFVKSIFEKYKIKSIFNLATNSFVERDKKSELKLKNRCSVFDNIIEAVTLYCVISETWIFHPLSSEIFGVPNYSPQDLRTNVSPITPYGFQKSTELIKCRYLNNKGFQIFHPILYNHESKYRSLKFFTKKIISSLVKLSKGEEIEIIEFYNSQSSRDFSYAYDFVDVFVLAMKSNIIGDELIGSGIRIKVIEFIEFALEELNISYEIVKYKSNNFLKIVCQDKIIAKEMGQDIIDIQRDFCFNDKFKNSSLSKVKITGGKDLIRKLIQDETSNQK
jgi:GDPmannose 4,6-dehydratase